MTITEEASEQAPPARHRSRRPLLIAGVGLVVAGAVTVYAAGWTSIMGVRTVTVEGAGTTPAEQIVAAAGIAEGTPMMRVDLRAATARLADLPQLASVDVRRQWPRTVVVAVTEREPVAMQKAADGWELLDGAGVPFAVAAQKPKDLPTIQRSSDEAANTAMLHALAGMTPQVRAQVAGVSAASPNAIRLTLRKGDAVVNWGSADESDYKSAVLAVLLGTDAGWYDVSNPDTPTTAPAAPAPATPAPTAPVPASGGALPDGQPPTASPQASPPAPVTPSPTSVEAPMGVVPD